MIAPIAAVLFAWLLGTLIVTAFWPLENSLRAETMLVLPLGALVGLGATSAFFFGASLVSPRPALVAGTMELVLVIGFGWAVAPRKCLTVSPPQSTQSITWLQWVLLTVFAHLFDGARHR